ncbi:MAG: hypothetical protein D6689_09450 [Deltaproteobacteria bacterium]|nr:MAG: hypothetical protein D6689_09450 [Deltaproteobacteria bacterium]
MPLWAASLAAFACHFDPSAAGIAGDGGEPPADAAPGAPDAAAGCAWGYMPVHFDPCSPATPEPDGPLMLTLPGTYVYDTDTGVLTAPGGGASVPASSDLGGVRAVWVRGLMVGAAARLRAVGSAPLLIASFGDIDVVGTIDASSGFDGSGYVRGAGANSSACPASPPDPGATCAQHGGSGGGGGAFGGDGGRGGEGGDTRDCGGGFPDGIPGGAGGVAVAAPPEMLRGGCAGADGAANNDGFDTYGRGGPGGGAVHLAARDALRVTGRVLAGGAGGGPGTGHRAGGGGGGSGGMIGLEGGTVTIGPLAVVAANGGGGGGGCDGNRAEPGEDGGAGARRADGGDGEGKGGRGGTGGALANPDGEDAPVAERGGGGGGGGAGVIVLYGPAAPAIDGAAVVSPAPIVD